MSPHVNSSKRNIGARMIVRAGLVVSLCVAMILAAINLRAAANGGAVGMFEDHADVGKVLHPGTTEYDAAAKTYTITGSGNNMWMTGDEFQFAWKKMSGDVAIGASISFYGLGGNAHRKAVLMIR